MRPHDTSEDEGDETEDRPPALPAEAELKLFGHTPAGQSGHWDQFFGLGVVRLVPLLKLGRGAVVVAGIQ